MNSLMHLSLEIIEKLNDNELFLLNGGASSILAESTNNGSGVCDGTNNGSGKCGGTNNSTGTCGAVVVKQG